MKAFKFFFVMIIFSGFAFTIIQQRLESKTNDIMISNLQNKIEFLQAQKREIHSQIENELQRISSYNYSEIGNPISLDDIMKIEISNNSSSHVSTAKEYTNPADHFLTLLIKKFENISVD